MGLLVAARSAMATFHRFSQGSLAQEKKKDSPRRRGAPEVSLKRASSTGRVSAVRPYANQ
jgi:hypothetical protein